VLVINLGHDLERLFLVSAYCIFLKLFEVINLLKLQTIQRKFMDQLTGQGRLAETE